MNDDNDRSDGSELSALYNNYFSVIPADTPELLDAAHALRYQVYCVEHAFEDPSLQTGEREVDSYDAHSVHAVLIYKPTDNVVGCVRLILPHDVGGVSQLPMRGLLSEADRVRLDQYPLATTAEISRYAVSKVFRRRTGEELYPDAHFFDLPGRDARRLLPHMSVALVRGVARLAGTHGIEHVCAAMVPGLLRLIGRFGIAFDHLGGVVDYHGARQPCIAAIEDLLAGMAERHAEYYRIVEPVYHRSD